VAVKRLEWYVFREVVPNFLIGTSLYVALFLFQSLIARAQYLGALPPSATGKWLIYQIPEFALRAFPLAIVFSVLLVFGRLAKDNELLASFAGGIGLSRLTRSLLLLGAALALFGLFLAEFVTPRANEKVAVTWWDSLDGGGNALAYLAGKHIEAGKYQLFFRGFNKGELLEVRLEFWDEVQSKIQNVYFADSALLTGNKIRLKGFEGYQVDFAQLSNLPENPSKQQLYALFPRNQKRSLNPNATTTFSLAKTKDTIIAENTNGGFEDSRSISTVYNEWRKSDGQAARDTASVLGYKTAVPFANLAILLLTIPIAAGGLRSNGVAFGIAVLIAVGYYLALFLGQTLGRYGVLPAFLGPWIANIALLAIGFYMLRRAQYR
jgi:lipopolysaccharide export system permease protein